MGHSGRLGILAVLVVGSLLASPARGENYYARIRANDAPIGGRFSIYAYALDSLDVAVSAPGPGRVLALNFREANGKDSFLIPGDLSIRDPRKAEWTGGFHSLSERRLAGLLHKDDSRWALWWVPQDTLEWSSVPDLTLHYGFSQSIFVPLDEKDTQATLAALPWDRIETAEIDPARSTGYLVFPPNPADFDQQPLVKYPRRQPQYPKSARMYSFEGTVVVAARVEKDGTVSDACVLTSDAIHQLNVSALVAVMDWNFRAGRKGGISVGGEMVIPVRFALGSEK